MFEKRQFPSPSLDGEGLGERSVLPRQPDEVLIVITSIEYFYKLDRIAVLIKEHAYYI